MLDACFSGQVSDGKMFASGLQPLLLVKMPENITVLSAGGASEFAGPLPNTARPAFSYLMLGAMRGWGDANGDKQVTAEEAVNYTRDVLQTVVKDRKQTPQVNGPKADFVLSKVEVLEQGPDLVAMVLGKSSMVAAAPPAEITPPQPPEPPARTLPITNPEPPTPPTPPATDAQNNNQRADSQSNDQRADSRVNKDVAEEGVLKIGSRPESTVFINGESKGTTPLKIILKPGKYAIKFVHPDHGEFTRQVTVEAGLERMLMHQWP